MSVGRRQRRALERSAEKLKNEALSKATPEKMKEIEEKQKPQDFSTIGKRWKAFWGNMKPKGKVFFIALSPVIIPLSIVTGIYSLLKISLMINFSTSLFWVLTRKA